MIRVAQSVGRTGTVGAFVAALALSACVEEPTAPGSPLIPPEPPTNPQVLSTAWTMDVFRNEGKIVITPPASAASLDEADLQIIADFFGIEPGSPDLSILAGDVIEIVPDPASLQVSGVGDFVPGMVRTTFDVAVRNKLSGVNIITPTFPAPPAGTDGVVLFPFEIVVTETPGGVSTDPDSDGTVVVIERQNEGQVAPSVDWDVDPFNFFNDEACDETSNDCYRSETFNAGTGIPASQTSENRTIGFDHGPTVSQFRVRMILSGDLEDAEPGENLPPTADAGGPYAGVVGDTITLDGSGSSDPDGTIVAFDWDLNNDGVFDEGNEFICSEVGAAPVALQVTDNEGATDTDATEVDCTEAGENQPPTADAGGPYEGVVGTPIALDGSASSDPDSTIDSYDWDFNNDGVFDDASGAGPEFTCSEVGTSPVALQVTDNEGATDSDSTEVNCTEEPVESVGVVRGRWVDAEGNPIEETTIGSTIFFELDIEMLGSNTMSSWQAQLDQLDPATPGTGELLLTAATQGTDLNCSNPGGQATCPSGAPAVGNNDILNQYVGNNNVPGFPGAVNFLNVTIDPSGAGVGIQGLARLQYTADQAGTVNPFLTIVVAAGDMDTTIYQPEDLTLDISPITVNP